MWRAGPRLAWPRAAGTVHGQAPFHPEPAPLRPSPCLGPVGHAGARSARRRMDLRQRPEKPLRQGIWASGEPSDRVLGEEQQACPPGSSLVGRGSAGGWRPERSLLINTGPRAGPLFRPGLNLLLS